MDNYSDILTLGGAGRQSVETRSTFVFFKIILGKKFKLAMWKVVIERTRARCIFLRTDKEISENRNIFYSLVRYSERREILGWVIKGEMMAKHREQTHF